MFKKRELTVFARDRAALALLACLFIGCLVLVIMALLSVRPTDVQVPIRHSDYGFTNLYRDKWYALYSFALFGIITFVVNGYLAIKLHGARRGVALGLLIASVLIIAICIIISSVILRLAAASL
jgi:hypothetical protein